LILKFLKHCLILSKVNIIEIISLIISILKINALARSPVFGSKLDYYYKNVIYQIPDSILKYTYRIVDQIEDSSDMMKFVLNYVHTTYETSNIMGMDAVYVGMSRRYYCKPAKNKGWWYPEQNLKDRCERTDKLEPLLLGKVAPPIALADTSEKKWINIYNLPQKHIVLIFWDPDCGHCKKEIPKLLKVYKELKDKKIDIEFVAVGTELENAKWTKFIKENNLNWINLSDFPDANKNAGKYVYEMKVTDYKSLNFRKEYDIFSTPQIYLLDENRKIVAKRLDANNLARILEKMLNITLEFKEDPKDKEKEAAPNH
jgi:peroxiredoxin